MGSDAPLVVKLEVTVPRIALSALQNRSVQTAPGAGEHTVNSWQSAGAEIEEMEQVRLLLPEQLENISHQPQRGQLQQAITGEASSRMIQTMRFRVFRIDLPAPQSQAFLLQVFRWCDWLVGAKKQKRNNVDSENRQLCLTDEMAFSLECRRTDEWPAETTLTTPAASSSTPISAPIPGLNRVVIFLDDEGTPGSYSIDGAES